jgi:hypothetical protein
VSHEAISQDRSAIIITKELVPPASIILGYAWQVSVSRKANKPLHRWRPFTSPLKDHLSSVSASALYSPLVGTVPAVGPLEGRRDLNVTMGGRKADPTSNGHTGNGLDHQMQGALASDSYAGRDSVCRVGSGYHVLMFPRDA